MENEKYTKIQSVALVILRVLIGWHFLYEGLAKMMKGNWSAAGFLMQSKWIFAPIFKWMASTPDVLNVVNLLNMWGLVAIGLGLILGCFTKPAAYAGIALILMYFVCNPPFPGLYYSIPSEGNYIIVNKNLVEVGALFVIAVTNSGIYAGMDRIIHKLLKKS
ncbi:DoxX family protein [candidate division KSB1 bacterium]|nr:DoxX family protein [candidate division KSB1 bacterium]